MGAACCVTDRNMPEMEGVHYQESDSPLTEAEVKKIRRILNDENDPDNVADLYVVDKKVLQRDMQEVARAALEKARDNSSVSAVPFLLTSYDPTASKVAILSRNYNVMREFFKYKNIDKDTITENWIEQRFTPKSLDKRQFMEQLNAFLM